MDILAGDMPREYEVGHDRVTWQGDVSTAEQTGRGHPGWGHAQGI